MNIFQEQNWFSVIISLSLSLYTCYKKIKCKISSNFIPFFFFFIFNILIFFVFQFNYHWYLMWMIIFFPVYFDSKWVLDLYLRRNCRKDDEPGKRNGRKFENLDSQTVSQPASYPTNTNKFPFSFDSKSIFIQYIFIPTLVFNNFIENLNFNYEILLIQSNKIQLL